MSWGEREQIKELREALEDARYRFKDIELGLLNDMSILAAANYAAAAAQRIRQALDKK
jgi:hypothetical protein